MEMAESEGRKEERIKEKKLKGRARVGRLDSKNI